MSIIFVELTNNEGSKIDCRKSGRCALNNPGNRSPVPVLSWLKLTVIWIQACEMWSRIWGYAWKNSPCGFYTMRRCVLRLWMGALCTTRQNTIIRSVGEIFKLHCIQVGKMDVIRSVLNMTVGALTLTEMQRAKRWEALKIWERCLLSDSSTVFVLLTRMHLSVWNATFSGMSYGQAGPLA